MLTQTIGKSTKNPCYKCEKRVPGCHSTCKFYVEWKKNYTQEAEKAKKMREMDKRNMRDEIHTAAKRNWLEKEKRR